MIFPYFFLNVPFCLELIQLIAFLTKCLRIEREVMEENNPMWGRKSVFGVQSADRKIIK